LSARTFILFLPKESQITYHAQQNRSRTKGISGAASPRPS